MKEQSYYDNGAQIIYLIHGFASAPKSPSDKADVLERVFEMPVRQLEYNSGAMYEDNMEALKAQVCRQPLFFVGTSLGGFYASKLAEHFYDEHACMPIMLNPCHTPATVLKDSIGRNTNFATNEDFHLSDKAVNSYLNVPLIDNSKVIPRWILLNLDDELIDANETHALFKDKLEVIAFKRGGHRFENIATEEVTAALQRINNNYFITGIAND